MYTFISILVTPAKPDDYIILEKNETTMQLLPILK